MSDPNGATPPRVQCLARNRGGGLLVFANLAFEHCILGCRKRYQIQSKFGELGIDVQEMASRCSHARHWICQQPFIAHHCWGSLLSSEHELSLDVRSIVKGVVTGNRSSSPVADQKPDKVACVMVGRTESRSFSRG